MKFLGQYIQQFKARFRDEVYLENIVNPGSDTDKFLVVDSDGKVGFRTGTNLQSDLLVTPGSHVVDLVTITSDSGAGARSAQTGQPAFTFLGGTDIDVTNSSGTFTVAFTNDSGYTTNTGDIDRVQISTSSVSPASVTSGNADFSITGSSPIGVSNSGTNITVAASDASTSAKGVASFSSDNFAASSGEITIKSGGVDLTDEVTGTLPVGNGGTGATSLTDNAVLLGNGTSAVEASSHLFLNGGNVGIGTNSPDSLLEISSSSATDFLKLTSGGGSATPVKLIFEKSGSEQGIIEYNRNGDLEIYNTDGDGGVMIDGSASAGGDLYVTNAGKVGIATTSPTRNFEVSGVGSGEATYIRVLGDTSEEAILELHADNDASGDRWRIASSNSAKLQFRSNGSNKVTFTGSGDVGIGTTSPAEKLTLKAASSSEAILGAQYSTTTTNFFEVGVSSHDSYLTLKNSGTTEVIKLNSDGDSYLNGGKVGIGTTAPEEELSVAGSIQLTNQQQIVWSDIGDGNNGRVAIKGDEDNDLILFKTDNSERMRLTNTGLGIGTTSPLAPLHIETADDAVIRLTSTDNKAYIALSDNDTNGYISSENSKLSLGANVGVNANNFNIDLSNNNVGIGTSSPTRVLHVEGSVAYSTFGWAVGTTSTQVGKLFNDSGVMTLRAESSRQIALGNVSGGEAMRIDAAGNVGIGVTSPGEKLDVDGDIKLSGDIELGHASDTTIARSAAGKVTIEGAPVQTTQMVVTTHNFQMANTTGTFFYIPFNNLNESSAGGTANYWTRTVTPYPGTIKKIVVRSHTSLGTSCELRISKITDTTDALTGGTHVDNTSIDISSANVSVIETMNTNSFAAGDAVGVALKRSAGTSARVVMTVVWEYTV